MTTDLTNSHHNRQNILNNSYTLSKVEEYLGLGGVLFEDELLFTKQQLTEIFDISDSTIEKYLAAHTDELKNNGYRVLKGQKLREFKALSDVSVINYGDKSHASGVFSFRATLNLAMLLTESEHARLIRSRILDIAIDVVAERTGGHTKYINQPRRNIEKVQIKKASQNPESRDALHHKLEAYIQNVQTQDFEKFLSETSCSLQEQLADPEIMAVFKRLKDR
jgi:hypothetical protein